MTVHVDLDRVQVVFIVRHEAGVEGAGTRVAVQLGQWQVLHVAVVVADPSAETLQGEAVLAVRLVLVDQKVREQLALPLKPWNLLVI